MHFLLTFCLFLLASIAWGQEKTARTLRQVEVSAQRRLQDAGMEVTTLDTTTLHQNIALSMADILSRHSTLFIKNYGRATEATAEFRGTSPSHTQVLWNGMNINSPMLGTLDFSTIPAYFIDQANLLHGASSLNLTSGGLGGAVELRSANPIEQPLLQFIQGAGSFGTFDEFLRLCYGRKRWTASTRVVSSQSDNNFRYTNYDKKVDVRDEQGNVIQSYHPQEQNKSGYFKEMHALQDVFGTLRHGDRLSLHAWFTHSLRGLPFLSVDYRDDADFRNEQQLNTLRLVSDWNRHRERWNAEVRLGYQMQDVAYDYTTSRQDLRTDILHSRSLSNTAFAQATANLTLQENLMLSATAATYFHHVSSRDRSPFHIGQNCRRGRAEEHLSLAVRWRPLPRLSLQGILREECCGQRLVAPIPALFADVLLFRPWNVLLKASAARNYRFPAMNDLYFQPGGNPDLRPENGITYDGGLEFRSPRLRRLSLKGNLAAFDSHISDWILWTPNAKGFWQPSNVRRVHNYGVEARLEGDVTLPRDVTLRASGNFAWTPSINKGTPLNSNDASYGKQLCYVPRRQANLSLDLLWRTWSLGYRWTYYSERFTTTSNDVSHISGRLMPCYMSDLSLEKFFHFHPLDASLRLSVNNLLSTEYVTVLSRPMPPRHFELFLKLVPKW